MNGRISEDPENRATITEAKRETTMMFNPLKAKTTSTTRPIMIPIKLMTSGLIESLHLSQPFWVHPGSDWEQTFAALTLARNQIGAEKPQPVMSCYGLSTRAGKRFKTESTSGGFSQIIFIGGGMPG